MPPEDASQLRRDGGDSVIIVTRQQLSLPFLKPETRKDVVYLGHLNGIKNDLTGLENLRISDTLCARDAPEALPALTVDDGVRMSYCSINSSACSWA